MGTPSPRGLGFFLVLCGASTFAWSGCSSPAYTIPQDLSGTQTLSNSGGTSGNTDKGAGSDKATNIAGRSGENHPSTNTGAGTVAATTAFRGIAGAGSLSFCEISCDATMHCSGGACAPLQCDDGWADCNGIAADGCEIRLETDPQHCGDCDVRCSNENGTGTCNSGECTIACARGYADCDAIHANGCETNLMISVKHCGECGRVCLDAVNGTALCRAGDCELSNCAAPYGDCDGNSSNGCESDGTSDVRNCGGCGVTCSLPHAAASCEDRGCVVQTCEEGWADCNGVAADGCEIQLSNNPSHCGACDAVCAPTAAEGVCNEGHCEIGHCDEGTGDCNRNASDGCETALLSDQANCGACGVACQATHGKPSCDAGACHIQCAAGYASCDNIASNGCETDTLTNPAHCGGCNKPCEGQCITGSCHTQPCSGLCEDPKVFTVGSGTISGISEKICHETYQATKPFTSGNCGLFEPGRVLYVNGVALECGVESWAFTAATRPAPRYGGYCFYDDKSGSNGATAWFNVW